ncbi:hypothetical protein M011DRAFT_467961 [Sporormia fimetaria CBS 119925]|uniref:DNA replication regulator SLD2 n=1 Tax=Sporormia fimetaria CBS 119925 TaxID=1340428 RepID=A0A6A6VAZ5_9PLEO|nr:hypothetical protein M011DRAFT_467961 [Sporormia fimetaria CBS 119925]
MDEAGIQTRCSTLRLELKAWEKSFAATHDGRKAGREDIKADVVISSKYKEYNKLRDILSGKRSPTTPSKRGATRPAPVHKSPQPQHDPTTTTTITPLKRKRDSGVSFTVETLPQSPLSPPCPDRIGPTPQRDGIVLGLFDLLESEQTPSKRRALGPIEANTLATPNKSKHLTVDFESPVISRHEKTPPSVGKQFLLSKFATPQKRKVEEEAETPSALRGLQTPAFLRRGGVLETEAVDENTPPRRKPWMRRTYGRTLSSVIQALKKQENDRLDEEADIMREMEMEAEGIVVPKKIVTKVFTAVEEKVVVQDSQAMPLGPDGIGEESDEEEAGVDANGQPTKVWKKRGQKRQTRRVIMRPNLHKPQPQAPHIIPTTRQEEYDSEASNTGILETQLHNNCSDIDDDDSDYATDASHTPKKRKVAVQKKVVAKEESKEGIVKKAARKIKATAHANYRRLKIKSKNGGGKGGKFGRRR